MLATALRLLATGALLLALLLAGNVTAFEDGSIQFFDTPGLGFCLPGHLCDEGN